MLLDVNPWLLVYDLLELPVKLLLVDEQSGGCKEKAVKCISTRLCGVSGAVEWITVSDARW